MKQTGLLILTILFSFVQVQAQSKNDKVDMAFDKTIGGMTFHDFGSIVFGANGQVDFNFTNKGDKPLVITNVQSSCGCTVPTWTQEPVEPGKKGTVTIVYNTKLPGVFNKTVVVFSNANNSPVRIEIRGKVNSQVSDMKPGVNMDKQAGGSGDAGQVNAVPEQLVRVMEEEDSITKRHAAVKVSSEEARILYEKGQKSKAANNSAAVKSTENTTGKQATGTAVKKK
jgi:hypothetical protein